MSDLFKVDDNFGRETMKVSLAWDEDKYVLIHVSFDCQGDAYRGIGLLWQRHEAEIIRYIKEKFVGEEDFNQTSGTPEQHLDEVLTAIIKAETTITSAIALTENMDKVYLEHLHGLLAIAEQSLYQFMQQ